MKPVESEAKMTTKFHRDWMAMDEYKEWLLPDEESQGQMQIVPKEFHPFQHAKKSLGKVMHRRQSTKVWCFMWQKELLPSRTI